MVLLLDDVDSRLVLVHGVQDDLQSQNTEQSSDASTRSNQSQDIAVRVESASAGIRELL